MQESTFCNKAPSNALKDNGSIRKVLLLLSSGRKREEALKQGRSFYRFREIPMREWTRVFISLV